MSAETWFTPHVTYEQGVTRFDNQGHLGKYLSAEMRHDTVCVKCGQTAREGETWTANLAEDPADATWEHNECPEMKA